MMDFLNKLDKNPVYLREIMIADREEARKKPFPRVFIHFAILLLPVLAGSFYGTLSGGIKIENLNTLFSFSMFFSVLFILITSFRGCRLFARERERKTYNDLITSTMSPEVIVLGKFWFSFSPAATELTIYFPFYLIMGSLLNMSPFPIFLIYLFTLVIIALFSMTGLYFSIKALNVKEAVENCSRILLPLIILATMACLDFPIYVFMSKATFGTFFKLFLANLVEILCLINPLTMFIDLFYWASSGSLHRYFDFLLGLSKSPLIFPAAMLIYFLATMILYRKIVSFVAEVPVGFPVGSVKGKGTGEGNSGQKSGKLFDFKKMLSNRPEMILFPGFMQGVFNNPIFLKGFIINWRQSQNPTQKLKITWQRLFFIAVVIFILSMITRGGKTAHPLSLLPFYIITLNFIIFLIFPAESISKEETSGTRDEITTSLLTAKEIFWGEFWLSFYPAARWFIYFLPIYLAGGVFFHAAIPGLILFYILTLALGASVTVGSIYIGLLEKNKIPLLTKKLIILNFPIIMGILLGSVFIVEKISQYLHLIPIMEKEAIYGVYPLWNFWIAPSKGFAADFNPVLLLSLLCFLLLNLGVLIPLTTYYYKNCLEILEKADD